MKSYILPIICGVLLLVIAYLTFSDITPVKDYSGEIKEIERRKIYFEKLADSLQKSLDGKVDTFYITKIKIKKQNDTIYIQQDKVGRLSADSSFQFFTTNTGATVIHD